MKKIFTIIFIVSLTTSVAQNPLIVKSVGTTVLEPNTTSNNEFWKNNEWNGLRFYQGKGTPSKLCATDGTTAGTKYISDIGTGDLTITIPAQDFMFLIVRRIVSVSPTILEDQLWKSDGTTAGTSLIYTFEQNTPTTANVFTSDAYSLKNYSVSGNTFYFCGYTAAAGRELWVSDGTTTGTKMVKDIRVGTQSSNPACFAKMNSEIFFTATESYPNNKLWKTDGTDAGTTQVMVAEPFYPGYGYCALLNNKMIFYATDASFTNFEPYVSDGTPAGTFKLVDINPTGTSHPSYTPEIQFKQNSKHAYFNSTNGTNKSLWRTDGTIAGTIQLTVNTDNVESGVSAGSLSDVDEDGLWMLNYNTNKLYKSDGTVTGTSSVASSLSYAGQFKIFKRALWFTARRTGATDDVEPWRSDGTAANTNRALDIAPGNYFSTLFSSSPFGYFTKNNKLYFFAKNSNLFAGTPMALYEYNGDFTFNGNQAGGRWSDSTNWNSMMPPGITDTVNINSGTANSLNITGQRAYAGVLNLGNNANINLSTITDSLQINNRLISNSTNSFTGNGVLVLRNSNNDTIQLSNSYNANNIAVQSNASLLSGSITVNGLLNLINNGKLILNNNNVTLAGSTSTATGGSTSYIVTNGTGTLTTQNIGAGARTGAINFPIGTVSNYNPLSFINTGVADNFSARVQPTLYATYTGENGSGGIYNNNVVNANWFITESSAGGSNAQINFQWNAIQELTGFDRSVSRVGHYTGGSWTYNLAGTATGVNPYQYSIAGVNSFSPFGIFNTGAVLPVGNINFTAKEFLGSALLSWTTSSELNSKGYNIQHSTNGVSFTNIGFVNGKGNSTTTTNYNFTHYKPSVGKNYYRLQALDFDGKTTLSNIEIVEIKSLKSVVNLYPNPTSEVINVNSTSKVSSLELFDIIGRKIKSFTPTQSSVDVSSLTNGMYVLKVVLASGEVVEEKIMIRR